VLTYFGSGYAFAGLERADGSALLGRQDVGTLGFKLREEFKNSSTFLWRQFQELRKRRQKRKGTTKTEIAAKRRKN
jgi:hypothetical protein